MPQARQDLETLRKRFVELDRKRTVAETQLRAAQQRLEELRREAREQYGTDDPEVLEKKLQEMQAENERKRAAYQDHLDGIESRLKEIEAAHGDATGRPRA